MSTSGGFACECRMAQYEAVSVSATATATATATAAGVWRRRRFGNPIEPKRTT